MAHLNARLLWEKYARTHFNNAQSILEIGPAGYPTYYEKAMKAVAREFKYHTLDIRTDFLSGAEASPAFIVSDDPYHYPIQDATYDIVFSDQVLAHVEKFWEWYTELARMVKPGGYIVTINSYSYPSCPSPIDAWRVSSDGMKILDKANGLETILSVTESQELIHFGVPNRVGCHVQGASFSDPFGSGDRKLLLINKMKNAWNRLICRIPVLRSFLLNPVNVAVDTITISRKPL